MKDMIFIMQGGPATGKTTVGQRLARSLKIPYFSKDGVKEPIFDDVGCPVAFETDEPLHALLIAPLKHATRLY